MIVPFIKMLTRGGQKALRFYSNALGEAPPSEKCYSCSRPAAPGSRYCHACDADILRDENRRPSDSRETEGS